MPSLLLPAGPLSAQEAAETPAPGSGEEAPPAQAVPEVRQLVTFRFLPGAMSEAVEIFRDEILPLYERNEAMLSFRGLREVESPEPLDLVVVSTFRGMEGMDASNEALRVLAEEAGTGIGSLYGRIAALSRGHHDQFVEMLPALDHGAPERRELVALVFYQVAPGRASEFEEALERGVLPAERDLRTWSRTGRFLLSDGWHYLRFVGLDSLGDYQEYWAELRGREGYETVESLTRRRKEILLAPVPSLEVR